MRNRFGNLLINQLIKIKEYRPLGDREGNIPSFEHITFLARDSRESLLILELIDGDELTSDEIRDRMEKANAALDYMKGSNSNIYASVFIFSNDIPDMKLEQIKNLQKVSMSDKKHHISFTIRTDIRSVEKHSKIPANADDLYKFFNNVLKVDTYGLPESEYNTDLNAYMHSERIKSHYNNTPGEHDPHEGAPHEGLPVPAAGKPLITYALIGINVVMWLITYYFTTRYNVNANVIFGAKVNPYIIAGQYWRLLTPIFLHGGLVHLAVNSYSLYAVGPEVERMYGRLKFIFIYLLAGIMGNVASFAFSPGISVGASGAIFGLLGALLYLGQRFRKVISSNYVVSIIAMILFNVIYGFSQPNIDNYAHLGGLAGGYLAAVTVGLAGDRRFDAKKAGMLILAAALIFGGLYSGFTNPAILP